MTNAATSLPVTTVARSVSGGAETAELIRELEMSGGYVLRRAGLEHLTLAGQTLAGWERSHE